MMENQVDCIVRFHDAKRLYELKRCVFSLVGQKHRPLHIIIAVQRFTDAQVADTRAALAPILSLPNPPTATIRNWESASPNDARTELLNMGLAAATGQYVSFLDYDDVLYPEAYAILMERLKVTGNAIAFATVRVVAADVFPEFIHVAGQKGAHFSGEDLRNLFLANFCPIHSYLIDRSIVSPDILSFDTAITWEEDYDLLLKICAAYPSDFAAVKKTIGDYYYKNDGSNSIPTNGMLNKERALEYERVQDFIEVRRRTTLVAPEVQKQLGMRTISHSLTIRDALNAERDGQIVALYNSTSWRITRPLRIVIQQIKRVRRVTELAMPAIKHGGGLKNTFKKAIRLYRHGGMAGIKRGFRLMAGLGRK